MTRPRAGYPRNCSSIRGSNKPCLVKTARLVTGSVSTHHHIPWEPGFFPGGKAFGRRRGGGKGVKLATHSYLVSRLGIDGAAHLIPRYTFMVLTLILFTWRIGWSPNNASKWHMGINSALKGLTGTTAGPSGRSSAEIVGSNPIGDRAVCLLCVLCVVR